jgi:hypothetical protein
MCKAKFLALFFMLVFKSVVAQVQPADGISINHTQIMFEHPAHDGVSYYVLCIYPANSKQPNKLVIKTQAPAYLVKTGLSFGQPYQWYYEAWSKTKKIFQSGNFSFSIPPLVQADTNIYRFTIAQKNEAQIKDGIVFFDNPGVAVDRNGKVVWVLPLDSTDNLTRDKVRNLHFTPYGTIMYLMNGGAAEKSPDGQLLWKAPNNTGTAGVGKDVFHHDCRRLSDGSYLMCNYRYELEPCLYAPGDKCQVRYNTMMQLSSNGKIEWYWNEKGHVSNDDIFSAAAPTQRQSEGTHMNGFDYNEKEDALIMSFRNNSRIIKVDKKSGRVLWEVKPLVNRNAADVYFENQHGITFTGDGAILVYNNSGHRLPLDEQEKAITWPTIVILKEQVPGEKPTAVWEYECVSAAYPKGIRGKEGYAQEVPGKSGPNILVCMGGANRSFEVTRQKQIVWECLPEQYDTVKAVWRPLNSYRSHFANSLYPYYLHVQPSSAKATKNQLGLTLFNCGSEADTYIIELNDAHKRQFSASAIKVNVRAGSSAMAHFPFMPLRTANKPTGITVTIRSQNSPAVKKTVSYALQ